MAATLDELGQKKQLFINSLEYSLNIVYLSFQCPSGALKNPLTAFCYNMFCFLVFGMLTLSIVRMIVILARSYLVFMSTWLF